MFKGSGRSDCSYLQCMGQPNPEVTPYFEQGCGRCNLHGTPDCRVHLWPGALAEAFDQLTPGRRRAYLMHFTQPKQAKTRWNRIEKSRENILNGMGLNDRYQMKRNKK